MNEKFVVTGLVLIIFLISGCTQKDTGPDLSVSIPEEYCIKNGTNVELSLSEAYEIAMNSECAEEGELKDTYMCNEYTGTWWIDLDPYTERKGCNPACVIDVETKEVEINWRCTGLISE